jgi:hypothetical protein
MDWIDLAQDRDQCRALENTVVNLRVGVRVPVGQDLSPLHVVQTGSGAHPASNPMGTGGSFPWRKAAWA